MRIKRKKKNEKSFKKGDSTRRNIKKKKKKKSGKEIVKLAFLEIKRTNIVEARTDKRESNTTHFRR